MTNAEIEALIAERVAEATAGLVANRDQILKELKAAERDNRALKGLAIEGETEGDRIRRLADSNKSRINSPRSEGVVYISREDAQSASKYRDAKDRAIDENKTLVIGEPVMSKDTAEALSPLKVISDDNTIWASKKYRKAVGVVKLSEMAAKQGKTLRIFEYESELSDGARAQAEFVKKAGDPQHFYTAAEMAVDLGE